MRRYSVIVPVYNRPDEVDELLASLAQQTLLPYEVILVEDGSSRPCRAVAERYADRLRIRYFCKENSGQGFSRNFGYARAEGDFFVVFDSDCLVPPHYFAAVEAHLQAHPLDAYGGPDRAHPSFTPVQKAISYAMTSPFTTGGIRGNRRHLGPFHPRSFNMGISRAVFEATAGYRLTRMGEDIEFSIRIIAQGFRTGLIPDAYVYHKRRTSLGQFYRQLHFFGRGRINIHRHFPTELKPVHTFPALFVLGAAGWGLVAPFSRPLRVLGASTYGAYFLLVGLDSLRQTRSLRVAGLSVAAAAVQLTAYGIGFLTELGRRLREKKLPAAGQPEVISKE